VNALDKLTYLVSYADTDWLDAHFDLDAGPDDIARTIYGEIRGEVLREAAEVMDAHCEQYGVFGVGDRLRRMTDAGQAGTAGRCRADIETALGTYPCERNTGHDGDCDERTEAEIAGTGSAPSGETTQPDNFFQPNHTYTRQHHGHRIEFLVKHVDTAPGGSYPIAFGWRREPCISTWAPEDSDDLDGWTDITDVGETTQPAPRTERSYWQAIADALNASAAAGMHVGIDIDGTLTDRIAWSVIWDRQTERWAVAGYENYDDQGSIEDAHSASELYEMDRDLEFRLDAEDDARNTAEVEADERGDAL
jgi:hypothetical protein